MANSTTTPAGHAIVTRIGWEDDEAGQQVFSATLVFPNGPPELPFNVVWKRTPVRIAVGEKNDGR